MISPKLQEFIASLDFQSIPDDRREALKPLITYVKDKRREGGKVSLHFICTHNSRRSQFSQVWASVAAAYYSVDIAAYSGGVEVTACNERVIASLSQLGFEVASEGKENPRYSLGFSSERSPIVLFSKLFDDSSVQAEKFAAVMVCAHADENCPYIPSAEARIPLRYEDPKAFDGTAEEGNAYDSRSLQIATELFYAFSRV